MVNADSRMVNDVIHYATRRAPPSSSTYLLADAVAGSMHNMHNVEGRIVRPIHQPKTETFPEQCKSRYSCTLTENYCSPFMLPALLGPCWSAFMTYLALFLVLSRALWWSADSSCCRTPGRQTYAVRYITGIRGVSLRSAPPLPRVLASMPVISWAYRRPPRPRPLPRPPPLPWPASFISYVS